MCATLTCDFATLTRTAYEIATCTACTLVKACSTTAATPLVAATPEAMADLAGLGLTGGLRLLRSGRAEE